MPRPPRIHVEGALCYTASKAMEGLQLFQEPRDYTTYLEFLTTYRAQFGFKLFAYMLLPDQLHLCLELTNDTTISTVMHALNSRYTKYVTKRTNHTGHVFQERFRLTLMEKSPTLLLATALLHRLSQQRGGVGTPQASPWSSYAQYVSSPVSELAAVDLRREVSEVLQQLSIAHPGMSYAQYVESIPSAELLRLEALWQKPVVGSEAFLQQVAAQRKTMTRQQQSGDFPPATIAGTSATAVATPAPSSMKPRVSRRTSITLTTSVSIAVLSLCVAGLYAKNLSTVRQTLAVMAQERTLASLTAEPPASSSAIVQTTTHPTTLVPPSALIGTVWSIQIKPMYAAGANVAKTDELRFESGKMISSVLKAEGFQPSNYSLTIQSNGAVLWETMQTGPNHEVICWRGEWDGKTMHGVLTRQQPGAVADNFAFIGTEQSSPIESRGTKET